MMKVVNMQAECPVETPKDEESGSNVGELVIVSQPLRQGMADHRRVRPIVTPPGEMPVEHVSAITPIEVLRWHTPRAEEANRWAKKPESEELDSMVHDAYAPPIGQWENFLSNGKMERCSEMLHAQMLHAAAAAKVFGNAARSTTNSAPPHDPPCGREAPQGRIDIRKRVVARSVEEGIRVLETHFCEDLDFVANARMSHDDVPSLQAPFREDDAKADYSKTATTQALVMRKAPRNEQRDKNQERKDAKAIELLRQMQAPAVQLLKFVGTNPTIHTLRVDCKNLGEEAFCTLAAALETNSSLRFLDCGSNCLTPHAAGLLGFSLRNHPLEELYLDFSNLGASGAHHFGSSLYGNTSLRLLSIRGNKIGPDFPKSLLWLLTPLPVSQGGGSSTKKDPDGPPVDDKGAQFQCPIQQLRLDDNPLKELPIRLGSIDPSINITMLRCQLEHPPRDVVDKGWQAIRAELKVEFDEYEGWHADQLREHNTALAHNPVAPPWQRASDYHGLTAVDLT